MNEDQKWFNQTLLTYKDQTQNEALLRVSISSSTTNFIEFSPPKVNISISNPPLAKIISLTYDQILDLVAAFSQLKGQKIFGEKFEIVRKYYKNYFVIQFVKNSAEEPMVKFSIRVSETDLTQIFVTPHYFKTIVRLLNDYLVNYLTIMQTFVNQGLAHQLMKLDDVKNNLRGIMTSVQTSDIKPTEFSDNSEKTKYSLEELDNFMGKNMENIKVPEIDDGKVQVQEPIKIDAVKSEFIDKMLSGDAMEFENVISTYALSNKPVIDLADHFRNELFGKNSEITFLPDVDDKSLKSLCFISRFFTMYSEIAYAEKNQPVPDSLPLIRYTAKTYDSHNTELAYDLLIIQAYVRYVCLRLESKSGVESSDRRNIYYLRLRAYTDPFIYSIIGDRLSDAQSVILNRFRYYKSNDVFKRYDKLLSNYNCPIVDESDIRAYINNFTKDDTQRHVTELHDVFAKHNKLFVMSENDFTLEQIINEIVPLEVSKMLNKDLTNEETVKELRQKYDISDEILKIYQKKKPTSSKTDKIKRKTNIQRIIEKDSFKKEIPEDIYEKFHQYIIDIGDLKFDFTEFDLSAFGERVVKALYCWNEFPESRKDYNLFQADIRDCALDKSGILAKYKNNEKNEESNFDFSGYDFES
jgi:hypothetical protein